MMHQRPVARCPGRRARAGRRRAGTPIARIGSSETIHENTMIQRLPAFLSAVALASLAACSSMGGGARSAAGSDADRATVVLPTAGAAEQMRSGCWASFYDERNFNGSSLTLIGPVELQTLDKGSARQLKRDIKSVVTGPRATLTLYEKQFLSARWVGFTPDSREPGLAEKLGFGGRIESMKLSC
jgi:hypothetical protein